MDALNMDTVCRLYEVGRQRLAEDEDEEEDQVSDLRNFCWSFEEYVLFFVGGDFKINLLHVAYLEDLLMCLKLTENEILLL